MLSQAGGHHRIAYPKISLQIESEPRGNFLDFVPMIVPGTDWFIRVLSTFELKAPHSTERLTLNTDQTYVFTFLPTVSQIFK